MHCSSLCVFMCVCGNTQCPLCGLQWLYIVDSQYWGTAFNCNLGPGSGLCETLSCSDDLGPGRGRVHRLSLTLLDPVCVFVSRLYCTLAECMFILRVTPFLFKYVVSFALSLDYLSLPLSLPVFLSHTV